MAFLAGVELKLADVERSRMAAHAKDTFWRWYDEVNPEVRNRKEVEEKRKNGDPDLIIAASAEGDGVVKVWTADNEIHYVRGYDKARDEFGTPYLSLCEAA